MLDTALSRGLQPTTTTMKERDAIDRRGVDTHKHKHVAIALDDLGQILSQLTIAADLRGYQELVSWIAALGSEVIVGIEGAGSYGAGLCEHVLAAMIAVVEVKRPRRHGRRRGKSDDIDALLAARKVLACDAFHTPRRRHAQALQALLIGYRSCVCERTRVVSQLQALHTTAHEGCPGIS